MYLISFIKLFFHSHFTKKFDETYKFFPCKKAYYVKRQDFIKKFFDKFAFYGLDMEPEPEP